MKPVEYRNRNPIEYVSNDFRLALKSMRYHSREYIAKWKRKKLPGIPVGTAGVVILLAGELIQGATGTVLFEIGVALFAVGAHFEIVNRIVYQYKYFIVPAVAAALFLVYLIRPQVFGIVLPRQYVTELSHFSSGFPLTSTKLTVILGGGDKAAVTSTKKQLEEAKGDSLSGTGARLPFVIYLDRGKLFIEADVFAGGDRPPILIRRNVIYGLPYGWDGNYDSGALEIVSADTLPMFQLIFKSEDEIRVNGVFRSQGKLVIADQSGVTSVQGKLVLFYNTKPVFKYPSWKYPHQRSSSSLPSRTTK